MDETTSGGKEMPSDDGKGPEESKVEVQDSEKEASGENKVEEVKEEPVVKKEVVYGSGSGHWKVISVVAILLLAVSLFYGPVFSDFGGLSSGEAEDKAVGFVNNLLAGQAVATPVDTSKEYGLYKVGLDIDGEAVDAYITPDGRYFFAQPIDINLFEQLQGLSGDGLGVPGEVPIVIEEPGIVEQDDGLILIGDDPPVEESSSDVSVSLNGFVPDLIPIKVNEEVSLTILSEDVDGLFRIDDFDISEALVAGEEVVVTFTPDKVGVHDFFVEGQGLSGAIVVEG